MKSKSLGMFVAVLLLVGVLFPLAAPIAAPVGAEISIMPIIFVHGFAGSAQQFASQAMRFSSNGYPQSLLFAFEWDSSGVTETVTARNARLDAFIAAVKAQTGATQVYAIGHSAGTTLWWGYLSGRPDRQANIAKLVQIDGTTSATPGGIPTLGIWAAVAGSGAPNPSRAIPGATNVLIPNQFHVEVATSAEAFSEMYRFFTGNAPATTDIVLEPCDEIKLEGKAVFFPWNRGVGDGTVEIWEVDGATGTRIDTSPLATYAITGTGFDGGAWGPFDARGGTYYEFVIVRSGFRSHHFYCEPFIRSDRFVRLLTSPPGGLGDQMERSETTSALVISRQKEFRSATGEASDILEIEGVNIFTALTPVAKAVIGIFAYDRYLDGVTNLTAPIPYFHAQAFMSGVDICIPGAEPPDGTISLVLTPRGGGGKTQVLNMPNWASAMHGQTALFNDYLQVDTTPPAVTITSPADAAEYLLNSVVTAAWTATDERCRLTATGTVPSGSPIDTSTVGTKTFTVIATDSAGNTRSVTHTYYVRYAYGGILQPINSDGSSVFRLGSTVPVKFQLRDANGAFVTNAVARIFVQKISDGVSGTEMEAVSRSAATTGNLFRYCSTSDQYIFNLCTKSLSRGTWQIRIQLGDGTSQYVNISLR